MYTEVFRTLEFYMPNETTIEVKWNGPFSWPTYEHENTLCPIPNTPGVYLQTFAYQNGYLIYAAGITRRTIPARFKEHTRKYMKGQYNILDIASVQQGIRKEIWHGWAYARKHREEFEDRKLKILDAVNKQLAGFRIFITEPRTEPRILERLEASIMNNLYQQSSSICDIPDKGMYLSPRYDSEEPIVIKNNCVDVLYGLPTFLKI
jgi:hypothetical protein